MYKLLLLSLIAVFSVSGCGKTSGNGASAGRSFSLNSSMNSTATAITTEDLNSKYANAAGSKPSSVKVKVDKAWVSLNEDCTNYIELDQPDDVAPDANGYFDMAQGVALVQGNLPAGTYNCFIMKMVDIIKFTPRTVEGVTLPSVCTAGTEYKYDTYASIPGGSTANVDLISGEAITPIASLTTEQPVYLIASTGFTTNARNEVTNASIIRAIKNSSGAVVTPGSSQLIKLTSALVAPGRMTFYLDPTGKIGDTTDTANPSYGSCALDAPAMGFR